MVVGPSDIGVRLPKAASHTLAASLVAAGLGRKTTPTHRGVWSVPHEGKRVWAAIREPVGWHLSHAHHWMAAGLTDRVTAWTGPDPEDAVRAMVLACAAPERYSRDLDTAPHVLATPQPGSVPVKRWCADREVGLLTWMVVHLFHLPESWAGPVPRGPGRVDVLLDADRIGEGLAAHGLPVPEAQNVGDYDRDPLAWLTPDDLALIRYRERAVLDLLEHLR